MSFLNEKQISEYKFNCSSKTLLVFMCLSEHFLILLIFACCIVINISHNNVLSCFISLIGTRFSSIVRNRGSKKQNIKKTWAIWLLGYSSITIFFHFLFKCYCFEIDNRIINLVENSNIYLVGFGCERESISNVRFHFDSSVNIYDCVFSKSYLFSGDGGVISILTESHTLSIISSMFYNCTCSNHGGAIYFSSLNSSLKLICACKCSCGTSSSNYYHFAFLRASHLNQVEYLSSLLCSQTTSGYYSTSLHLGFQKVDNTNSSMNNAIQASGILIFSPSTFTSSFSTFSNNKASGGICIYLYSTSGTISMSYANIVHNNSPQYDGVIYIREEGSRKMMFCIFQNNHNYLFCVYGGSLEVSHSLIDHSISLFSRSIPVLITNNNTLTNTLSYQIQFFKSHYCKSDVLISQNTQINNAMRSYFLLNDLAILLIN